MTDIAASGARTRFDQGKHGKTRLRVIAVVALLVAIPALTWVLGIAPLHRQAAADTTDAATTATVNAGHGSRVAQLKAAESRISSLNQQLAALNAALPDEPQVAALLAEVGNLAKAEHVQVTGFTATAQESATLAAEASTTTTASTPASSSAGAAKSELSIVPVDVQVQGSLKHVRAFLAALQTGSRLVIPNTIAITADGGAAAVFTADVAASAYLLPSSD